MLATSLSAVRASFGGGSPVLYPRQKNGPWIAYLAGEWSWLIFGLQQSKIFPALTNVLVQFPNSRLIKSAFFHTLLPDDQQHCNPMQPLQGYLAHEKQRPPRTLQ